MRNTGMKGGKGLKSSTSLGSSSSSLGGGDPIASSKSLSAGKRLKARSKKKAQWFREERAPFVADFLARNPRCGFRLYVIGSDIEESPPLLSYLTRNVTTCDKRADDVHELHPQGRGGDAIPVDGSEENFLQLCRAHHIFVTQNPAWARKKGYTR